MTEEEKKLWKEYERTKDIQIRDTLIRQYIPLCKHISGKIRTEIEFEDILSFSYIGLIDAINKFSLKHNAEFKTYAYYRIKGAIRDEIRKQYHKRIVGYKQYKELISTLEREPTAAELIKKTGFTERRAKNLLEAVKYEKKLSYIDNEYRNKFDLIKYHPENQYEKIELKKQLVREIENLPEKEKKVIILYVYEELTQKEIGYVLNVTESRISQLLDRGLKRLKGSVAIQDLKCYISYKGD